jgi:hypothetical protein
VGPRIHRPGGGGGGGTSPSATPSPTQNPTADFEKYFSEKYGFEFKYPKGSTISDQSDVHARVSLPILVTGKNLTEKYVDMSVIENAATCTSPDIGGEAAGSENVTINGIQFLKETGAGAATGNLYEFVAYSTKSSNNTCVSLTFVLHSFNPDNTTPPTPEFDKAAESAIFDTVINTYDWTG